MVFGKDQPERHIFAGSFMKCRHVHHFCEVSRKNLTGPHFGDSGLAALGAMSELLQPAGEPEGVETTSAENMRHRGRGRERERDRERKR